MGNRQEGKEDAMRKWLQVVAMMGVVSSFVGSAWAGTNNPPKIDSVVPEGAVTVQAGANQTFEVCASDADVLYYVCGWELVGGMIWVPRVCVYRDGEHLTYAWKVDGKAMSTTTACFTYAPTAADAGSHVVEVTVSDGRGGSTTHSWLVTVVPPPVAP